jgi:UDP-glucose 4-epimerase
VLSRRLASADFLGEGWHQGDLRDAALLHHLLPQCGTVVHLAADTTPGASAHAASLETSSFAATLGLLDLLQSFPATRLIYFSSGGTIYGNPERLPGRHHRA